jgi:hypothetical protein
MPTAWTEPADVDVNGGWKNTNLIALVTALQAWFGNIDGLDFAWPLVMAGDMDGCGQSIYNVKKWLGPAVGDVQVRDASGFGMSPSNTGTQNATALQAAIDDLPNGTGGCVVIPPGVYTINPGIIVDGSVTSGKEISNVTLMGFGDCTTLIRPSAYSPTTPMLDLGGQANMAVSNLKIDGNYSSTYPSYKSTAITGLGADSIIIGVTIHDAANGVQALDAARILIKECRFSGVMDYAAYLEETTLAELGGSVSNCHIESGGILVFGAYRGLRIYRNFFCNAGGYGVALVPKNTANIEMMSIRDNIFSGALLNSIHITGPEADHGFSPRHIGIVGNIMRGGQASGINFQDTTRIGTDSESASRYHVTIGNIITDATAAGIHMHSGTHGIVSPSRSTFSGNVALRNCDAGIKADGNDHMLGVGCASKRNVFVGNALCDDGGSNPVQLWGIYLNGSRSSATYAASVSTNLVFANVADGNSQDDYDDTGTDNVFIHNQET